MKKLYICEKCKEIFEITWTDEEAAKEYEELFPEWGNEPYAIVCDDCFKKILETAERIL